MQKENQNKIIMIKTGAFFNSIGRDAIILEKILGLKRSCFGKGICKVGFPESYLNKNLENIKNRLKEKKMGIIIYDEKENGRYKFNNKSYERILEIEGKEITEQRKNTNCSECKKNIYNKGVDLNIEQNEKLEKEIEKFLENIEEILNIKK